MRSDNDLTYEFSYSRIENIYDCNNNLSHSLILAIYPQDKFKRGTVISNDTIIAMSSIKILIAFGVVDSHTSTTA